MDKKRIQIQIKKIVEQLVKKYRPEKIILFGSAAKEDSKNINDIDFLIIKNDVPRLGIDRIGELDRIIDRDEIAVDMIVLQPKEIEERLTLGDPFIKSIIEEGKVLYG